MLAGLGGGAAERSFVPTVVSPAALAPPEALLNSLGTSVSVGDVNSCIPSVFSPLRTALSQILTAHLFWMWGSEPACCKDTSHWPAWLWTQALAKARDARTRGSSPAPAACAHRQDTGRGAGRAGHADGPGKPSQWNFSEMWRVALLEHPAQVQPSSCDGEQGRLSHISRLLCTFEAHGSPRHGSPCHGSPCHQGVPTIMVIPKCLPGEVSAHRHLSCPIEGKKKVPTLDLLLKAQERATTGCLAPGCHRGLTYPPSYDNRAAAQTQPACKEITQGGKKSGIFAFFQRNQGPALAAVQPRGR